jgi:hypothetical protein
MSRFDFPYQVLLLLGLFILRVIFMFVDLSSQMTVQPRKAKCSGMLKDC